MTSDGIEAEPANCKQRGIRYHFLPRICWQITSPGIRHRFSAPLFTYACVSCASCSAAGYNVKATFVARVTGISSQFILLGPTALFVGPWPLF
jgi:hypothetical protein